MQQKIKKILTNILKFGGSIAAIWWVFSKISFKEVLSLYSSADFWYLAAAFLLITLSFILSGFRQNLSFKSTGAHLTPILNLKLFWLGLFYNLFLPSGIGGDGIKVYLVNKYRLNGVKKNIGAMLVNRIAGLVAVGMLTILLYFLSGDHFKIGWIGWLLAPALYLFYYFVLRIFLKSFVSIHAGLFGWSMLLQFVQLLSAMMILFAFHQSTEITVYLFLFFLSAIATALPITIGGVGARELAFVYLAQLVSLNKELAVALSLMFNIISALISLGGIYWLFFPPFRREKIPHPKVKQRTGAKFKGIPDKNEVSFPAEAKDGFQEL